MSGRQSDEILAVVDAAEDGGTPSRALRYRHLVPARLRRSCCWREVQKPGDGLNSAIDNHRDVDATGESRTVWWTELPGKAGAVVVRVHVARARQAHAGKLRLHALQHGVNPVVSFGGEEWVEILTVLSPGTVDYLSPPLRIDLVPGFHVAIDERRKLDHV